MGLINGGIVVLCACGIALSCYAVYIDESKHRDENYKPRCDLDEKISCSKALTSEYSRGLGLVGKVLGEDHFLNIPNSYMGVLFFPVMMVIALSSSIFLTTMAALASLLSSVVSAYLMYILTYVISTVCLVCLPIHFINIFVLILYIVKWNRLINASESRTKKE